MPVSPGNKFSLLTLSILPSELINYNERPCHSLQVSWQFTPHPVHWSPLEVEDENDGSYLKVFVSLFLHHRSSRLNGYKSGEEC